MADVLLHPTFPTDRLDRIKFQQTSQIAQRRTNPTALTAELAARVYYGGTPYARLSPKGRGDRRRHAERPGGVPRCLLSAQRRAARRVRRCGHEDAPRQTGNRAGRLETRRQNGGTAARRLQAKGDHESLSGRSSRLGADGASIRQSGRALQRPRLHSARGRQPYSGRRQFRAAVPEHPRAEGLYLWRVLRPQRQPVARPVERQRQRPYARHGACRPRVSQRVQPPSGAARAGWRNWNRPNAP